MNLPKPDEFKCVRCSGEMEINIVLESLSCAEDCKINFSKKFEQNIKGETKNVI